MYYICGFAIPFFFMSSGYFLLNRGKINFKYSIKKNCAIIRIVFIWNLIYLILKAIKGYFTEHLITVNILSIFHYYYMLIDIKYYNQHNNNIISYNGKNSNSFRK